jgi:hypothetical protein
MRIIGSEQNTEQWFIDKLGRISGSRVGKTRFGKLASKTELVDRVMKMHEFDDPKEEKAFKAELKKAKDSTIEGMLAPSLYEQYWYRAQKKEYFRLLAEKLGYFDEVDENGKLVEDPRSRGHRLEDKVAEKVEKILGIKSVQVGICVREDYEDISVSPDRLVITSENKEEGVTIYGKAFEIKNPGVVNHLEIYFTQRVPSEYWEQVIQYFVVNDDLETLYFVSDNENVRDRPTVILEVKREDIKKEIAESLAEQIKIVKHLKADMLALSF